MLLHWCTLEPLGPSKLAAVRFAFPIRVRSVRIFPTDAKPFAQCPDIVARTEPSAFFLDVFFNAQSTSPEAKDRPRAPNALVPTVIAYAGGQMDFMVNMSSEHTTRLMIIKGDFQCVSMAIYGEVISEVASLPNTYEARAIPSEHPLSLAGSLDPSHAADPTLLAKQLLTLIPDSPPLPLIIRLMMCLKPSDDDWDHPDFPFLFNDLDDVGEDFDLEKALHRTYKPVTDDASAESIQGFADKVASLIDTKSCDQSPLVAGILNQVAPQHPAMAQTLMSTLDWESLLDVYGIDIPTLGHLLDAAANVDVAQFFNIEWFLALLRSTQEFPTSDREMRSIVRRLAARIRGWEYLEDSLTNPQADFAAAVQMTKEIGMEENSLGIWLVSMITNPRLITKLAENSVLSDAQCPSLLSPSTSDISHRDFIAFLRAYIGVSSVMAVYAWSDSLPEPRCRERTLGILRLWQSVDGYREIVNHLLLLRQMMFRLSCLTDDHDPPTLSSVHGEHILVHLANDPHSMLNSNLIKCVSSRAPPLSYITEEERSMMCKLAYLAKDGLPSAMEQLMDSIPNPIDMEYLRFLRLSLAVVAGELGDDDNYDEMRVVGTLWDQGTHGLTSRLIDIFTAIVEYLRSNFLVTAPPRMPQSCFVEQLLRAAADLLGLVDRIALTFPPLSRTASILGANVADLFVLADAVNTVYSHPSSACTASQIARQKCIAVVRHLSDPAAFAEHREYHPEIIFDTLLQHGLQSDGLDPAIYSLQVFSLIDHLLPSSIEEDQADWVTAIIPHVLPSLSAFFRVLDVQNKVHLFKRLVHLDGGVVGIGEWLLSLELKDMNSTLRSLYGEFDEHLRLVHQYKISLSLHFLSDLLDTSSTVFDWFLSVIRANTEIALSMTNCFIGLADGYLSSPYASQIARVISNSEVLEPDLRTALVLILLRDPSVSFSTSLRILLDLPPELTLSPRMGPEIGRMFTEASEIAQESMDPDIAGALLSLLEKVAEHQTGPVSITGTSVAAFTSVCNSMKGILSSPRRSDLKSLQTRITIADMDPVSIPRTTVLADHIEFSIQDLLGLLEVPARTPSTPKRTTPDVLNIATISPPTALLRSPAATGLTKTYLNNDFRQLRQLPSARQNTSRLPSLHVDDFESSPVLSPAAMPDVFQGLSPQFGTL